VTGDQARKEGLGAMRGIVVALPPVLVLFAIIAAVVFL
jgi:hypothetical protein